MKLQLLKFGVPPKIKKKKKEREIPPNCDSFIFKFNPILNLYSEIKVKANKKLGHESFALQAPPTLK